VHVLMKTVTDRW